VSCTVVEATRPEICAILQTPEIMPETVLTLSLPTLSCVVLARPLKFAAASTTVPVNVGLAESTMLPVPVTAFDSAIPPYVRASERVRVP